MKDKFPKSNIQISGNITISFTTPQDGFKLPQRKEIVIGLDSCNNSQSGVYCLRNKFNGRLYIGMARNLEVRQKRHSLDLLKGIHCSKKLQEDFNIESGKSSHGLYPHELFEFEVIIYCRPSELTFYEHLLIKYLNPYYNVHKEKKIEVNPFTGRYEGTYDQNS